jgi:FPC/CPF motif-containing protein YcgG
MYPPIFQNDHPLARNFIATVQAPQFPCVGAKSALAKGQMDIIVARDVRSAWDDMRISPALGETVRKYREDRAIFRTLIVLFEAPALLSEEEFEAHLWARAQSLSDKDEWLGFFVVGLHPNASRPARKFESPAMVFNLHDQFEVLRDQQRYDKLRSSILARDLEYAGSMNPMLARHGESSEARQYSGRVVEESWKCPFKRGDARG